MMIVTALCAATPTHADVAPPTIVGFARNGRQVLLRRGDGTLQRLSDAGRLVDQPLRADPVRRFRYGSRLRLESGGASPECTAKRATCVHSRVQGQGVDLRLAGHQILLRRHGRSIRVWSAEGCPVENVVDGWRSANGQVLALVLQRACRPSGEVVVISLVAVSRTLQQRGAALARQGKPGATEAYQQALALQPGAPAVIYGLAVVAALQGDQRGAVAWLAKLRGQSSAAARRLLVRARFDRDFRLIKDSASFRAVVGM